MLLMFMNFASSSLDVRQLHVFICGCPQAVNPWIFMYNVCKLGNYFTYNHVCDYFRIERKGLINNFIMNLNLTALLLHKKRPIRNIKIIVIVLISNVMLMPYYFIINIIVMLISRITEFFFFLKNSLVFTFIEVLYTFILALYKQNVSANFFAFIMAMSP